MDAEVIKLLAEFIRLRERHTKLQAKVDNVREVLKTKGVNV